MIKDNGERRLTIGVLVHKIDSFIEFQMVDGISEIIEGKDFNMVMFARTFHCSPGLRGSQVNKIYELAASSRLDGLIIVTSLVTYLSSEEEISNLVHSFGPIPMVSIQVPMEGIPSVVCNNKAGIKEVLNHLINEHGYRKIGFIRGPETNREAEERYSAYIESMEENNLPIDPEIVFKGNFSASYTFHSIDSYLQVKKNKMEALVAANDVMLIGACQALEKNGFNVPEDVALTGFDDLEKMKTFVPPVTTVRQPFYEMGKRAVELLIDKINGVEVPFLLKLPTKMMVRRSCGCLTKKIIFKKMNFSAYGKNPNDCFYNKELWDSLFQILVKEGQKHSRNQEIRREQFDSLLEALDHDMKDNNNRFFSLLEDILAKSAYIEFWTVIIDLIQDSVLSIYEQTPNFDILEKIFIKVRYLVDNIANNFKIQNNYSLQKKTFMVNDLSNWIFNSLNLDEMVESIHQKMPLLGIGNFYISLYQKDEDESTSLPKLSKLIMAYDKGCNAMSIKQDVEYPTLSLLPDFLTPARKNFCWLVMPLSFGERQFGNAVLEFDKDFIIFYSYIMEHISMAINNIFILEEKEKAKEKMLTAYSLLQKSEEHFREMVSLLPYVIVETDLELNIQFFNNAGLQAFGLDEGFRIGELSLNDFVQAEDKQRLIDFKKSIISGNKDHYHEFQLINKNGSKISLLNQAAPIYQETKMIGIRWCAIDIQPLVSTVIQPDNAFFKKYKLRPRDKEILLLMLKGFKKKEIADKLFISEGTVKFHVNAIYNVFGVKNKEGFLEVIRENQISRFGYEPFFFTLIAKILKD